MNPFQQLNRADCLQGLYFQAWPRLIRTRRAGRRWGTIPSPSVLFKNTKLRGENMYLQFRAETFNLFNHTNFAALTTSFISASFGKVTTANDPRIMQLGLQFYF
jgi:hypothetical protein